MEEPNGDKELKYRCRISKCFECLAKESEAACNKDADSLWMDLKSEMLEEAAEV